MIRKNKKGFTLMELVVTTAIMGILAAVAVPSFIETNLKAKADKTIANLSDIGSAVGQKFNELATNFGSIEVFPDSGTAAFNLSTSTIALKAWAGGGDYPGTSSKTLTLGEVIAIVPVSPFGDNPYTATVEQQAEVAYTTVDGNVVTSVIPAIVTYRDQEDTSILAKFSY